MQKIHENRMDSLGHKKVERNGKFLGTGGNRGEPRLVDFDWRGAPAPGPLPPFQWEDPEPPPQQATAVLDQPPTATTWTAEPVDYRPVGLTADPNGRLELNGRCRRCGRRVSWCDEVVYRPEGGQWVPDERRVLPFDADGRRHNCVWERTH